VVEKIKEIKALKEKSKTGIVRAVLLCGSFRVSAGCQHKNAVDLNRRLFVKL